ncbi:hypothetical protein ACEQ8H_005276 [Pleosporales sp. CAS-2024a]
MAFRPLLRHRAVVPAMAAAVSTGILFTPRMVDAEERPEDPLERKPIYDDMPLDTTEPTLPSTWSASQTGGEAYRPTPTDRLAVQIGRARMALYHQAVRGETAVDKALTQTLRLEHSFTSTVRSLAPAKESGEKVLPGALYVLVASMAGSIMTRNRNIVLRASVPVAVGMTAAHFVLPVTWRNVGDLVWTYEKRYPVVADAHLRTRQSMVEWMERGKAQAGMGVGMVEDTLQATKHGLEEWVRKGR